MNNAADKKQINKREVLANDVESINFDKYSSLDLLRSVNQKLQQVRFEALEIDTLEDLDGQERIKQALWDNEKDQAEGLKSFAMHTSDDSEILRAARATGGFFKKVGASIREGFSRTIGGTNISQQVKTELALGGSTAFSSFSESWLGKIATFGKDTVTTSKNSEEVKATLLAHIEASKAALIKDLIKKGNYYKGAIDHTFNKIVEELIAKIDNLQERKANDLDRANEIRIDETGAKAAIDQSALTTNSLANGAATLAFVGAGVTGAVLAIINIGRSVASRMNSGDIAKIRIQNEAMKPVFEKNIDIAARVIKDLQDQIKVYADEGHKMNLSQYEEISNALINFNLNPELLDKNNSELLVETFKYLRQVEPSRDQDPDIRVANAINGFNVFYDDLSSELTESLEESEETLKTEKLSIFGWEPGITNKQIRNLGFWGGLLASTLALNHATNGSMNRIGVNAATAETMPTSVGGVIKIGTEIISNPDKDIINKAIKAYVSEYNTNNPSAPIDIKKLTEGQVSNAITRFALVDKNANSIGISLNPDQKEHFKNIAVGLSDKNPNPLKFNVSDTSLEIKPTETKPTVAAADPKAADTVKKPDAKPVAPAPKPTETASLATETKIGGQTITKADNEILKKAVDAYAKENNLDKANLTPTHVSNAITRYALSPDRAKAIGIPVLDPTQTTHLQKIAIGLNDKTPLKFSLNANGLDIVSTEAKPAVAATVEPVKPASPKVVIAPKVDEPIKPTVEAKSTPVAEHNLFRGRKGFEHFYAYSQRPEIQKLEGREYFGQLYRSRINGYFNNGKNVAGIGIGQLLDYDTTMKIANDYTRDNIDYLFNHKDILVDEKGVAIFKPNSSKDEIVNILAKRIKSNQNIVFKSPDAEISYGKAIAAAEKTSLDKHLPADLRTNVNAANAAPKYTEAIYSGKDSTQKLEELAKYDTLAAKNVAKAFKNPKDAEIFATNLTKQLGVKDIDPTQVADKYINNVDRVLKVAKVTVQGKEVNLNDYITAQASIHKTDIYTEFEKNPYSSSMAKEVKSNIAKSFGGKFDPDIKIAPNVSSVAQAGLDSLKALS